MPIDETDKRWIRNKDGSVTVPPGHYAEWCNKRQMMILYEKPVVKIKMTPPWTK